LRSGQQQVNIYRCMIIVSLSFSTYADIAIRSQSISYLSWILATTRPHLSYRTDFVENVYSPCWCN